MSTPAPSPPQRHDAAPAPALGDTVPLLRADLLIGRGEAPGALEVKDPGGGGALLLLDAEVSVARMLDGRRTVAEVIDAAELIGIPVDADGLGKFIRGLARQGLLAEPGARAPVGTRGRPGRNVWDAATRDRFRAAVKLVRTGQPEAAVPILRALVAQDPGNAEAQEQLALIEAGHALAARPIGEVFAERPAGLRRRAGMAPLALAAAALALAGLGALAWRALEQERAAVRADAAATRQVAEAARQASGLARETALAGGPGAPGAASGARTAPLERRWHPVLGELKAPAAGTVAWREPLPSRIARGERLGEVRGAAEPAAPGPEARERLEALEALARQDPVYQEFLERERASLTGQAGAGRAFGLVAPAAGALSLVVRSDGRAGAGDLVARVVDPETWRVAALLRGPPPALGTALELAGDGEADRAAAKVVEVRPGAGEAEVILALPGAQAPWLEGARAPYLRLP